MNESFLRFHQTQQPWGFVPWLIFRFTLEAPIRCARVIAIHCNALQHTVTHCNTLIFHFTLEALMRCAKFTAALQPSATHCNPLQHTATHCNTLHWRRQIACTLEIPREKHCKTLQHTATHCNTLQHTAATRYTLQTPIKCTNCTARTASQCNTLQHTATHCKKHVALQHTVYAHHTHHGRSHTHEWVTSHVWMNYATHMNESCHTYEGFTSHMWVSHITHTLRMSHSAPTNASGHTYK